MGLFKKVAKAVLPAAGQFFGGNIGGVLGTGIAGAIGANDSAKLWEDQFDMNAALQREFAQYGIRWRVEDAKAAGVHPVFALGAGGAAFAPSPVMVGGDADWSSNMGQDLRRAVTAQMDPTQRRLQEAQLAVLESEAARNNAIAQQALRSAGATSTGSGTVGTMPPAGGPIDMTGFMGNFKVNPNEVLSADPNNPGIAAGPGGPGMNLFVLPGGMPVLLPGKDISEALESMSESALLTGIVYKVNAKHFGDEWGDRMLREYIPGGEEVLNVRDAIRAGGAIAGALVHGVDRSYPMPPAVRPDEYSRAQGNWMTRETWMADRFRRRNAVGPSRWRRN